MKTTNDKILVNNYSASESERKRNVILAVGTPPDDIEIERVLISLFRMTYANNKNEGYIRETNALDSNSQLTQP